MTIKFYGSFAQICNFLESGGFQGRWREQGASRRVYEDSSGVILNWVSKTGSVWFQGDANAAQRLEGHFQSEAGKLWSTRKVNSIFVVHGHDLSSRDQIEAFLHKLGIQPRILAKSNGKGLTLIEALEAHIIDDGTAADFGIVLLTPDDYGYSKKSNWFFRKARARQNVILEMGMVMAALTRGKVAILKRGKIETPSDVDGIIYLEYNNDIIKEVGDRLIERFEHAGIQLDEAKITEALR
jgi:predicted nucleotide-binding protein